MKYCRKTSRSFSMKRKIFTAILIGIMCFSLVSCQRTDDVSGKGGETTDSGTADQDEFNWEDDPVIGKVQPGCYKRIGITKKDETYEEMLELRDIANKGYLFVNEDGTATFEIDGEKTEYSYDEFNLYPGEDTDSSVGTPYVFIGGRLIVNDGATITQYLKLSDEETENELK